MTLSSFQEYKRILRQKCLRTAILGQVNPNNAPPPKSELPIFHYLTTTTSYPSTYVHPHFCLAASSTLAVPLFCNLSALLWPGFPPNSEYVI